MDGLMEQAGNSLEKMGERLQIYPFQDRNEDFRLFLARYEFPAYAEEFQHPDGVFLNDALGFIDFLGGFPLECVEMLVMVGEHSSEPGKVAVKAGEGAAPPVPQDFFSWPEQDRVLLNTLYLAAENVKWMAKNLDGEPEPMNLHWWLRVNLRDPKVKFPVPGEFLGLGVRLMPDVPWGAQKSSPFLYSGNWLDTVYYTGARVTAVDASGDVPVYQVQWRQQLVWVKPSDFAEYRVGDRVTILKKAPSAKSSQRWKDADTQEFNEDWVIVPAIFYGW
jgi:hypothetical protein